MSEIKQKIQEISQRVAQARQGAVLASRPIRILGASKQQSADAIREAFQGGIVDFGENRVQEAREKWETLKKELPGVRLHLIGPLQSNKAAEAVALFDVIQTLDREKLAAALSAEMAKQGKSPELFIQVNTGEEPQKAGIAPREADAFIRLCKEQYHLSITGLMCIPPSEENPAPHFALLHEIAQRNGIRELSMGMSEDFDIAVRFGATYVRLGRILFGERA